MFHFKSYYDLSRDIAAALQQLPRCDMVVGIPRSGLIPGIMIASFVNRPFIDLDAFLFSFAKRSGVREIHNPIKSKQIVLVVDDSTNTGFELRRAKERVKHLIHEFDFKFCAIYGNPEGGNIEADCVLAIVPHPRVFQWNYRQHGISEYSLFDMDGVLCADPREEDNDDGDLYRQFVLNAPVLTVPAKKLAAIVTSRLERFRPETEEWLNRNGVNYGDLIMLDLPTAEERRRLKAHGPFKAAVYKNRPELLFVESNWKQAVQIAKLADKPVICTQNDALLWGSIDVDQQISSGQLFEYSRIRTTERLLQELQSLYDRLAEIDPLACEFLKKKITYDVSGKQKRPSIWLKNQAVEFARRTEDSQTPKLADERE